MLKKYDSQACLNGEIAEKKMIIKETINNLGMPEMKYKQVSIADLEKSEKKIDEYGMKEIKKESLQNNELNNVVAGNSDLQKKPMYTKTYLKKVNNQKIKSSLSTKNLKIKKQNFDKNKTSSKQRPKHKFLSRKSFFFCNKLGKNKKFQSSTKIRATSSKTFTHKKKGRITQKADRSQNKRYKKNFNQKKDKIINNEQSLKKNVKNQIVSLQKFAKTQDMNRNCLLYTSPSPRDGLLSRMPSSA